MFYKLFFCAAVPLDSMLFSSMTTSMQLAEECLRQEPTEGELRANDAAQPFEGLELFAQTIDAGMFYHILCSLFLKKYLLAAASLFRK